MNRRKNGIVIETLVSKTKARKRIETKASSEKGKFHVGDVPKKLYEFVKREEDLTVVTIFTPFTEDGKALREEGYTYVATHDVQQPKYEKLTE